MLVFWATVFSDLSLSARWMFSTRLPGGHPEGYIESFANLYRDLAAVVRGEERSLLPGIQDGLRSMTFVETAIAACRGGKAWVDLEI